MAKGVSITTHRGRAGLSLVLLRQGANVVELRGSALRELLAAVMPRGPADVPWPRGRAPRAFAPALCRGAFSL